jgi:Flp pilus assembly protein TadG
MTSKAAFWRLVAAALVRPVRSLRAFLHPKNRLSARHARKRGFLPGEEGAELVELALTAPILFGFVFGLMQVCLAFYSYEYISELAREGARYAAVHGPSCETSADVSCAVTAATVNAYVTGIADFNLGGGTIVVDTTYPGTGGELVNNPVVVKITYSFPYKIPYVKSTTLTMTSTSQMTIIQ